MPETISTSPVPYELYDPGSRIPIESFDESINRLSNLDLVPFGTDQAPEEMPEFTYTAYKFNDEYVWARYFGKSAPEDKSIVDPAKGPKEREIFELAEKAARGNESMLKDMRRREGRWWVNSPSEKFIDDNVREGTRINDGRDTVDLLNCTESDLSDEERASIEKVFKKIVNYTGGKVFERIKGIALLPGSEFNPGIGGDFQATNRVLRVNMDALREREDLGRYAKYFEPGQTSWFEIVLAHELGHSMDIATLDEVDAHGIDKDTYHWSYMGATRDFGAFDDRFGWSHDIHNDPNSPLPNAKTTVHEMSEDMTVECREYAPTDYAVTNPREDFAESFAIESMGGDMSGLQERSKVLKETINKADGGAVMGPKLVTFEPITEASQIIRPINRAGLRVYVAGLAA